MVYPIFLVNLNSNSDLESIADDMIEHKVMTMLSDLLMEAMEDVGSEEKESRITSIVQPRKLSDSFDGNDSYSDVEGGYRKYNYSPEYKIVVEDRNVGKVSSKWEESKFDTDDIDDFDDGSISHSIDKYSIDTSKMATKMEDVGSSPYKLRKEHSTQLQTDAMCINCEEFISAKNIEIHSQYCTGQKQPKSSQPFPRETLYRYQSEEEIDYSQYEGVETDTIPRVNQRLYKLLKALKQKEVE